MVGEMEGRASDASVISSHFVLRPQVYYFESLVFLHYVRYTIREHWPYSRPGALRPSMSHDSQDFQLYTFKFTPILPIHGISRIEEARKETAGRVIGLFV
jgi:hypothetical protein